MRYGPLPVYGSNANIVLVECSAQLNAPDRTVHMLKLFTEDTDVTGHIKSSKMTDKTG